MSDEMHESRLPGIGMKYVLVPSSGGRVTIILHNDGKREIYYARGARDTPVVVTLTDDEARQLGAALGGAWERPKIVEDLELALGELQIEWITVPNTSPFIGKTLAEARFRADLGITVIAILREPEPITGAMPIDTIERGDVLVTVGKAGSYGRFRTLLAHGR